MNAVTVFLPSCLSRKIEPKLKLIHNYTKMIDIQVYSPGDGYGLVIGLGFGFAIIMALISKLLAKYNNEIQDSEMLLTAKKSIRPLLVSSGVISSWTIGSTLLLSCTGTYNLGVSGSYWYGAGACVQIIIFCCLAIEIKRRAPNAHTYQEIVKARYGKTTHTVSIIYSFIQMIAYTTNLLINGSSIFSQFTGMNRDVTTFLFPIGVIIYSMIGGIKATFITDYTHVVIIYVLMLIFMFKTYTSGGPIGSPEKLYDLLVEASERRQISGNEAGSLMTMNSQSGGLFGLVLFGAGYSAAVDSQLMSKAISAEAPLWGYLVGGLAWFTIPFCLATTLGLAAAGLETTKSFPSYPDLMTPEQISSGLVMPLAAKAIMGNVGIAMVLLMVFMAVTAAFSSETMAVSSLFTHDVYKAYINPKAKGSQLVWVAHSAVIVFGIITIGLGIGLSHAGFDVSFITTVSGIIVDVNVFPMFATLFWKRMTAMSYYVGTILCTLISVAVWMGYTVSQSGVINLTSLSTYEALAAGNTVAIGSPFIICPLLVLVKPGNFDWNVLLNIKLDDNQDFDEKHGLENVMSAEEVTEVALIEHEKQKSQLERHRKLGFFFAVVFVLFFLILFPLPLYGTKYVFSKTFFRGWIVVMFIWGMVASITVIVGPLVEGRKSMTRIFRIMFGFDKKPEGDIYYMKSHTADYPVLHGLETEVERSLTLSTKKKDISVAVNIA